MERSSRNAFGRWSASASVPWRVDTSDAGIAMRVPIVGDDGHAAGVLVLRYERNDPLLVRIEVRAPSERLVLERSMMRADLRLAPMRSRCTPTLTVAPENGDAVRLSFHEDDVTIHLLVPSEAVATLMRGTERIVSVAGEERELDRLLRALVDAYPSAGAPSADSEAPA